MGFVSSIIVVDDVFRSRKLYENIMLMQVAEDHGIYNVGFVGGLSLYQKALFQNLTGDLKLLTHPNNFVLYFEVDDPVALEKEIISQGFEFIHQLREQPWKQLVFRFMITTAISWRSPKKWMHFSIAYIRSINRSRRLLN